MATAVIQSFRWSSHKAPTLLHVEPANRRTKVFRNTTTEGWIELVTVIGTATAAAPLIAAAVLLRTNR